MRNRSRAVRLLAPVFFSLLVAAPAAAQGPGGGGGPPETHPAPILSAEQLRTLDGHIDEVRRQWNVPGLAIAIVQGDSVVFAKGYGVKELGGTDPVDENTLFSIGSSGKSMTSAVVSMLVDEGAMRLDDPVWAYLPDFRVDDLYVSRHATIRDLLSHRTGLENSIGAWYGSDESRAEIIERRFRFLKQQVEFRSRMLYNNLGLMTAGEAASAAGGEPFEELMRDRLFRPLGMTSTVTYIGLVPSGSNIVSPHMEVDGELVPIPHRNTQNIGGAGGYYSSARDMAQYLRFQLGNGVYRGERLVSEPSMREMRSVNISTGAPVVITDDGVANLGYGLGWFLDYYRGHRMIRHGGAIDGMLAEMMILPEDQIGVVVLTNRDGHAMHTALTHHVFDVALGLAERDWNGELVARMERARQRAQGGEMRQGPAGPEGPPSLPLAAYAGEYADSLNGTVDVTFEGGALRLAWEHHPGFAATLEPWRLDTFHVVDWESAGVLAPLAATATFQIDRSGGASSLEIANVGTFGRVAEEPGARGGGTP